MLFLESSTFPNVRSTPYDWVYTAPVMTRYVTEFVWYPARLYSSARAISNRRVIYVRVTTRSIFWFYLGVCGVSHSRTLCCYNNIVHTTTIVHSKTYTQPQEYEQCRDAVDAYARRSRGSRGETSAREKKKNNNNKKREDDYLTFRARLGGPGA